MTRSKSRPPNPVWLATYRSGTARHQSHWPTEMVRMMLESGALSQSELRRILAIESDPWTPSSIKDGLETWFKNIGLTTSARKQIYLSPCPFSHAELQYFRENNLIVLCVPSNVRAKDVATAVGIDSWAFDDDLVSKNISIDDDWFAIPATQEPPFQGQSARETKASFEKTEKYGLTLQRYMLFLGRMKMLTGDWPDRMWWTWILRTQYDKSGILIAGIDQNGKLSIHGWMSDFKAKFCGARYCVIPKLPGDASKD